MKRVALDYLSPVEEVLVFFLDNFTTPTACMFTETLRQTSGVSKWSSEAIPS